jgi:hypothetical protein
MFCHVSSDRLRSRGEGGGGGGVEEGDEEEEEEEENSYYKVSENLLALFCIK